MIGEIWIYIGKVGAMWGFIGSIIVLIVNLYVSSKGKKEGLRPYIEVLRVAADPEIDSHVFASGSKLVITKEYQKILSKIKEENELRDTQERLCPTFIKIKNISSNPCFGLKIKASQQNSVEREECIDMEFYVLNSDDELYIPLEAFNSRVYPIKNVEVEYTTLANEKMIYKNRTIVKGKGIVEVLQSIYVVKKWWRNEKIVQNTCANIRWKTIK